MSLNFFFPEKSPAADVDNAESPRGQPAKSGTTWQPRHSILVSSHGREREDKLGFEGEKREGKESGKGERRRIWVEGGERIAGTLTFCLLSWLVLTSSSISLFLPLSPPLMTLRIDSGTLPTLILSSGSP